jgi:hypothetical protein
MKYKILFANLMTNLGKHIPLIFQERGSFRSSFILAWNVESGQFVRNQEEANI